MFGWLKNLGKIFDIREWLKVPREKWISIFLVVSVVINFLLFTQRGPIEIPQSLYYTIGGLIFGLFVFTHYTGKMREFSRAEILTLIQENEMEVTDLQTAQEKFPKHDAIIKTLVENKRWLVGYPITSQTVTFDIDRKGYVDEVIPAQLPDVWKEMEESDLMKTMTKEMVRRKRMREELIKKGYSPEEAEEKAKEEIGG